MPPHTALLHRLLDYIRRPTYPEQTDIRTTSGKLWDVVRLVSIQYVIGFVLGIAIAVALEAVKYPLEDHAVVSLFNTKNILLPVLLSTLIAPLIEEFTFRLPLRFSVTNIAYWLPFVMILIYHLALSANIPGTQYLPGWLLQFTDEYGLFSYVVIVLTFGTLLRLLLGRILDTERMESFYRKHISILYYISAVMFGLIHITNYDQFNLVWWLTPLLISPQLLGGFIWGFLRVHYGVRWSILIHSVYNFSGTVPLILLSLQTTRLTDFFTSPDASHWSGLNALDIMILSAWVWILLVGCFIVILSIGHALYELFVERFPTRHPIAGALLSLVFPGLGQLYLGHKKTAVIIWIAILAIGIYWNVALIQNHAFRSTEQIAAVSAIPILGCMLVYFISAGGALVMGVRTK